MTTQPALDADTDLTTTPGPVHTPSPVRSAVRRFVLVNDPRLVGPLVAQVRDDLLAVGMCDRHAATRVGIALEEAILNAVYHGNLEISSKLKENGDGPFLAMAAARRAVEPYASRRVRVLSRITKQKATFVITDEGPGFDVSALPDPTDPANLELPSGRGVLFMRTFMDDVRYNPTGNRVTLVKKREPHGADARAAAV